MSKPSDSPVIKALRTRIANKGMAPGVGLTYRVTGGARGDDLDLDLEVRVGHQKSIEARLGRDEAHAGRDAEADFTSVDVDETEVAALLAALNDHVDHFVTRDKARFLPDTPIGILTIEVDGEEQELFFIADEDLDTEGQIPTELRKAVERFDNAVRSRMPSRPREEKQ